MAACMKIPVTIPSSAGKPFILLCDYPTSLNLSYHFARLFRATETIIMLFKVYVYRASRVQADLQLGEIVQHHFDVLRLLLLINLRLHLRLVFI